MISGAQIREARQLLCWSSYKLAFLAGVLHSYVANAEKGVPEGIPATARKRIQSTLEAAGVEFTDGEQPALRLRE